MPSLYELHSEEKIQAYTAIIRNFLNYLLHHDVCPEHRDDVNAARAVCDRASTELWEIACAYELMPGTFHRACSVLFGGFYQNTYIGDQEWAQDFDVFKGMSPDEARNAFKFAFSSRTSMAMYERYKSQSASQTISMTSSINTGLEITHIAFADREVLKVYNKPEAAGLKPPGTMKARTWYHPYVPDEDVTEEEEEAEAAGGAPKEIHEYEFWVDNELLQRCYPGMKFETTVHHLSFGLDFFDNVAAIYCSFFTTLPNEEMIGWKEPGPRLPMREKVRNPTDDTEGGHGVEEIE